MKVSRIDLSLDVFLGSKSRSTECFRCTQALNMEPFYGKDGELDEQSHDHELRDESGGSDCVGVTAFSAGIFWNS